MKVFIGWSGPTSEKVGAAIKNWLPNVLQSVQPYFTPSDIEKGTRSLEDITKELVIIYLTNPENMVEYYHNEQERQTVQGSGKSLQGGNKPYRII